MRDQSPVGLPDWSSLIDEHRGRRQEHIGSHRAVSNVERVKPVRPAPYSRRAAETVVELPAHPLTGDKAHSRGPSWPRRHGKQGLDPGKDTQPTVVFPELDVDLPQVFLAVIGSEAVSLMHANYMRDRRRHIRDMKADRDRVPASRSLSSPGLLRPGRPYPLNGDIQDAPPATSSKASPYRTRIRLALDSFHAMHMEIDPVSAWERLRASRSKRPGRATAGARAKTYSTALEQAQQMFRAAQEVGPQTRPLLVFYGLSQAGRAIAASAVDLKGESWNLVSHGIKASGFDKDFADIELRTTPREALAASYG